MLCFIVNPLEACYHGRNVTVFILSSLRWKDWEVWESGERRGKRRLWCGDPEQRGERWRGVRPARPQLLLRQVQVFLRQHLLWWHQVWVDQCAVKVEACMTWTFTSHVAIYHFTNVTVYTLLWASTVRTVRDGCFLYNDTTVFVFSSPGKQMTSLEAQVSHGKSPPVMWLCWG